MSPNLKFRTCFLSFILLFSTLSIFAFIPENVKAEPASNTILYFTDYFGLTGDIYDESYEDTDSLYPSMSLTPPTKDNDSQWPPKLGLKLRDLSSNMDAVLGWLLTWIFYKSIESEFEGLNESELEELENLGLLDLELELFNPFKITESFIYEGKETLEINGNIVFNLYFSSTFSSKFFKDYVKVSVSQPNPLLGIPQEIENGTGKIKTDVFGGKTQKTIITIEEVSYDLEPGEPLFFSVELIPTEKLIGKFINTLGEDELMELLENLADALTNQSTIPALNEIGQFFKDNLLNETIGDIFSVEDLAELVDVFRSSSFLFDSVSHPSSVTLPAEISGVDDNIRIYYLHGEGLMNEEQPEGDKPLTVVISGGVGNWNGPELERSKMLKKAAASLYIDHQDLYRLINILKKKIIVTATILDGENEIASSSNVLSRNTLLGLLQKPNEPLVFTFSDFEPYEIEYEKNLQLAVYASDGGLLGFRRNAKLLYDSNQYPSSLTVEFDETDHIKMEVTADPFDEKIALGGIITYTLNLTSEFEEDIEIVVYGFSPSEEEKWDIAIPESFTITEGENVTKTIVVISIDDDLNAYENEDLLDVTIAVEGKTGKDTYDAEILISEDAVEYDIEVIEPPGKKIKHGTNDSYHIKIKNNNTGYFPDSYTIEAFSENDWNLSIIYEKKEIPFGKEIEFEVKVFVPEYTDIESDILTVTIISDQSESHGKDKSLMINLTTTVISPNILELIYRFFETTAEDLGLDDILGSYAPHALAAILLIIIFFFIIIILFFLTIKYVNIVCLERIKEIIPGEEAKFEITIQNPYKKALSYEIYTQNPSISPGWKASLDTDNITVNRKQSQTVILTVKPTNFVKQDDWVEVKIYAKPLDKRKISEISVVTMVKDAKPDVNIIGVFHWPRVFKKGDRVVTSFKVYNRGNASVENVNVILFINGEEKNKVENITISCGGYAEIKMPWIAVKGKNEINIVVK